MVTRAQPVRAKLDLRSFRLPHPVSHSYSEPVPTDFSTITLPELLALTDAVPVMLACYDVATHRCIYANGPYAALGGMTRHQVIGKTIEQIIGSDAAQRVKPHLARMLAEKRPVSYTRPTSTSSDDPRWIEVQLVPAHSPLINRFFVIVFDVTPHRLAELQSLKSATRLGKFMQASIEGIAFHVGGTITDVNPPLLKMLGYEFDEMVGHQTLEFVPPHEHLRVRQVIASESEIAYESFAVHKDGRALPVEYSVRNFEWDGKGQRLIIVRDLSERRAAQERIRFLALHDVLTGLPNRAQLDDHLSLLLTEASRLNTQFSVLFIDLDQLKRINDSLGHSFGDMLLANVGERLLAFCEAEVSSTEKPWLARLGGDEFVITLSHADAASCHQFSARLQAALQRPIDIQGRKILITASVGVAGFPHDGDTPSQLLKNADMAMYHAKASGRDTTRFFDQSLARAADHALVIEEELGVALQSRAFVLHYQPEVSTDGKRVLTAEALIRWQHPTRGLLGPDEFIPIAEGLHLIVPIGQWVIDEALAQVPRWRQLGWHDAKVAVNLSSNQMRTPGFADHVLHSLHRLGLGGECLELELTERMVMSDDGNVLATLTKLKAAGVSLAIDDFGTGLSSLSRLRTSPVEKLKIDKSFVLELPHSASSVAIVKSILELARGLSLSAVAEGVETHAQRQCLESLGCHAMQGFLFTEPLAADAFATWLKPLFAHDQSAVQAG
jgi:diguanylate cyclase (GGDEF)-like protein/PAS domain S-box-containing protein